MKRREAFEEIGKTQGWHHVFAGGVQSILPMGPFQLLHEAGRHSHITQGMKKNGDGVVEILFDLEYLGNNNHISTTCYYILDKEIRLPIFYMQPKSSLDFLSKCVDKNVVVFDNFPDFNDQYKVISPTKNIQNYPINNQVLTYFSFEKGWNLEGYCHQLLLYKHGKFVENDLLIPFVQVCQSVIAMFKGEEVI